MSNIPKGSIVSYEPQISDQPIHWFQIDAMLCAQSLGLKSINAYTGNSPVTYQDFWSNINEKSRINWLEANYLSTQKVYVIH